MRIKELLICFGLVLGVTVNAAEGCKIAYGLKFRSHSNKPEDRTGLALCPDWKLSCGGGLL